MTWKELAYWKKGAIIGAFFGFLMAFFGLSSFGILPSFLPDFIPRLVENIIPETVVVIL